ncbi:MAG: homoserine O-acetyltransferase [Candidatus Omnitrophica bacterium]|nr:homoserine O-acetyltransferase [Candidatus Omnitrophota bacterium]
MADIDPNKSVGIVAEQFVALFSPPNELVLDNGEKLGPITLAYETYGRLNAKKDNAILILHALSGDHHAAGFYTPDDRKPGWWDLYIGPGKAFDTDKYFIICSNCIGGCRGSTGPASIDPRTGKPYALSFPFITIHDMVKAQKGLIEHLGIKKLLAVAGGSMGGMQALEWAVSYPDMIAAAIPVATTANHSAQNIALNEVARQSIIADPNWKQGDYYDSEPPARGLAVARMVGHISYLSDQAMHEKFGRRLQDREVVSFDLLTDFQVESYLHYQGNAFTQRFDANSYLYISKALDYFDLKGKSDTLAQGLRHVKARFLVLSFSSDWLYPPYQSREIVKALKQNGLSVSYCEIKSEYGHDSFLLDNPQQIRLIRDFLHHVSEEVQSNAA